MADLVPTTPAAPRSRWFIWAAGGLLLLNVALGVWDILVLPPMSGPDEDAHLAYVQVLRTQHALPVLPRFAAPGDPRAAEQAQHPPLYYAVLAAVSPLLPDPATPPGQRCLKLVSLLMGLAGLIAFAVCAREMWPEDDVTALGAVGFLALTPNYWVLSSHINNSAGALAASGIALMLLRRAVAGDAGGAPARRWLAVGLAVGLGMLAKITAAWLVPVIVVALWLGARRHGGWRTAARYALPALGPIVVLVGVWLARNWLDFGQLMPERVLGRAYLPLGFMTVVFQPAAALLLLRVVFVHVPLTAFAPYWLMADSAQPFHALAVLAAFVAPPLGAAAVGAWRLRGRLCAGTSPRLVLLDAAAAGIAAAWFIALQAVLHDWNTGLYAGRYAVDALPAVALLFAAGTRQLLPGRTARALGFGVWLLAALASSLAVHLYMVAFFWYR